jgi:hypothetical protein
MRRLPHGDLSSPRVIVLKLGLAAAGQRNLLTMKHGRASVEATESASRKGREDSRQPADVEAKLKGRSKGRHWKGWLLVLLILVIVLGTGRAMMPWAVRNYVNRTLDRNPLYSGKIGPVEIHLWRGAYSIRDVQLSKTTGNVPVPLFAAKRLDFALEWKALWHRKVVGRVLMEAPELNFVDAPTEDETQTGTGGPWLQMIRDLFPFKINSAIIRNGSVHFRAYQTQKPVDVYLSELEATIDNLGNIRNQTTPLVSTVTATALAMDQAKLEL